MKEQMKFAAMEAGCTEDEAEALIEDWRIINPYGIDMFNFDLNNL